MTVFTRCVVCGERDRHPVYRLHIGPRGWVGVAGRSFALEGLRGLRRGTRRARRRARVGGARGTTHRGMAGGSSSGGPPALATAGALTAPSPPPGRRTSRR